MIIFSPLFTPPVFSTLGAFPMLPNFPFFFSKSIVTTSTSTSTLVEPISQILIRAKKIVFRLRRIVRKRTGRTLLNDNRMAMSD